MAVFASGAQASCPYDDGQPVFSPWGDQHDYVLTPDGGFESGGAGWSLSGGAAVVAGNESYFVNGAGDASSLSLPAGSTAVSPDICVARDTPWIRMFAVNGGDPSSRLKVTVAYDLPGTGQVEVSRRIKSGDSWQPTIPIHTSPGLSMLLGSVTVQLTPQDDSGSWQVDDLYVDPFARH